MEKFDLKYLKNSKLESSRNLQNGSTEVNFFNIYPAIKVQ